jgi:hypothetical protein
MCTRIYRNPSINNCLAMAWITNGPNHLKKSNKKLHSVHVYFKSFLYSIEIILAYNRSKTSIDRYASYQQKKWKHIYCLTFDSIDLFFLFDNCMNWCEESCWKKPNYKANIDSFQYMSTAFLSWPISSDCIDILSSLYCSMNHTNWYVGLEVSQDKTLPLFMTVYI